MDGELDDELRFHLERQVALNVSAGIHSRAGAIRVNTTVTLRYE